MADAYALIEKWMAAEGKSKKELVDLRLIHMVPQNGKMVAELDFSNGHVTYTRIVAIDLNRNAFRSVTARTRLHVPKAEVPPGAIVYSVEDGNGPEFLKPFDMDGYAAVEFFYSKREGCIVGSLIMAEPEKIEEWGKAHGFTLDELVHGCKFDLWAVTMAVNGIKSHFNLPRKEQ